MIQSVYINPKTATLIKWTYIKFEADKKSQ